MRNAIVILILVVALALSACGGGSAGSTPEETFAVFKEAVADEDFETLYDLMQPGEREETRESWEKGDEAGRALQEEYARKLDRSADELKDQPFKEVYLETIRKMFDTMKEREPEKYRKSLDDMADAEILEVDYNEDKDRAKVKYKAGEERKSVRFYLEDGLWYLRFEKR